MSALLRARIVFWIILVEVILLLLVGFVRRADIREGFDWLVLLVVVFGGAAVGVVGRIRRRPLRATDAETLAASYVGRAMLGAAIAEMPVVLGFAGTLIVGRPWAALFGGVWGLAALWTVAPTETDIERRQAELAAAGSPLSLRGALGEG
jgi:hypothetical protein